jgi:hypothetical protein
MWENSRFFIFGKSFPKIYAIFVRKFSRKANINFRENEKTKVFVSTLKGSFAPLCAASRIQKEKEHFH